MSRRSAVEAIPSDAQYTPPPPPYTVQGVRDATSAAPYGQSLPSAPSPQQMQRPMSAAYPPSSPQQQSSPRPAPTAFAPGPNPSSGTLRRSNTRENQLAILKRYDTVLLIDDSLSMQGQRWHEAEQATMGLLSKVVEFDADGIDLYFLCSPAYKRNMRNPEEAQVLFSQVQPRGESTPLECRVVDVLGPYVDMLEQAKARATALPKPLNLVVITDGEADDPDTLGQELALLADRLDAARLPLNQLGIQFVQIGDDPEATQALQDLDDNMRSSINPSRRDMVDTTPFAGTVTAAFLLKALLGGVNRRMDATNTS